MGLVLAITLASAAMAASPGCTAVNSGQLNYSGSSPTAQLGLIVALFYPGDQLFMTYTSSTPKAGVVLNLILTSISVSAVTTGPTGTTQSLTATVGPVLPIGAQAGITDATALVSPRNVVLTVTCTPAAAPSTLAVTSPASPTVFGQSANVIATAASSDGAPTGNIVFTVDGIAQPAVALVSGIARLDTATLGVGNHTVSASYAGSTAFTASSGTLSGGHTVSKAATSTVVTTSAASADFGMNPTWTATTTASAPAAGTPTGSMVFTVDGIDQAPIAMTGGTATLASSALGVGSHTVTARYLTSTNYLASTGTLSGGQTITKAATTTALTQSTATTVYGQGTTFRATVASAVGPSTGTVVFTIDGVAQSPVTLTGGFAELTTSTLTVGSHAIAASYAGTASLAASNGSLAGGHTVHLIGTTTVLLSQGPVVYGNAAIVTATVNAVSGTPAGSIVFTIDGIDQAPIGLVNGVATITLAMLSTGTHTVEATYGGSLIHATSSGPLAGGQVVSKAATTTAITPIASAPLGQSINLAITVSSAAGTPGGSVVLTIDGTARAPISLTAGQANLVVPGLDVGSHVISAAYSGAANFAASSDAATAVINKAASSVLVTSSANPAVTGQGMTITAVVSATASAPTGTVVFAIDGIEQSPISLVGGAATLSLPSLSVGTHTVFATYEGNGDLLARSASLPGGQTVERAATAVTLQSDHATSAFGSSIAFSATVGPVAPGTGTPSGVVVFRVDGVAQAPASLTGGIATLARSDLGVGSHIVTAFYLGDADFIASSGALPGGHSVTGGATTTNLAFAPANPTYGDTATLTATVTVANGTPAGSVVFTVDGADRAPTSLVNGVAQLVISNLSVGNAIIGARFVASTNYAASAASDMTITTGVAATATAVTASPASIRMGEPVTLSTVVSTLHGTPRGSVEFHADGVLLGAAALANGSATLSTSALTRGSHAISVRYLGSADHAPSAGILAASLAVTPGAASLAVMATPQAARFGEAVSLTATASAIAGIPTGTVVFTVDGVAQPAVALASGVSTMVVDALEPGIHTVTASYSGSTDHLSASATLTAGIAIDKAVASLLLAAVPTGPVFGETVTIEASLTSTAATPTGDVVFIIDGVAQAPRAPVDGIASIALIGLTAGPHSIEARFAGDSRFEPVDSALSGGVTVAASSTTMTLDATPMPASFGAPLTFSATVTAGFGSPTGVVVFTIDDVAQAPVALAGGIASLTTAGLTVGPHTVSASYAAQGNYSASSATLTAGLDIDVAATQTRLAGPSGAVAVGETARFIATVTGLHGTPSGAVVFSVDGVDRAPVTLSNGRAALDLAFGAAGNHSVVAVFTGSAHFGPSNDSLATGITIDLAATQTVVTAAATSEFGASLTVSAIVTATAAAPTGTVAFLVDGIAAGSAVLINGAATAVLPQYDAGSHQVTATYAGTLNFAASTATAATVEITAAPSSVEMAVSSPIVTAGEPVTIVVRAKSSHSPATGTVNISVGGTDYVTALHNGVATLTISTLAAGTVPVSASYAGSTNFAASSAMLVPDLIVEAAPADIEMAGSLPRSVAGELYAGSVTAFGGTAPYMFTVTNGSMPHGLSLDSATGAIAGTPSLAGVYAWEITASGSGSTPGLPAVYQANLIVLEPANIVLRGLPNSVYGEDFNDTVAVSTGTGPFTYVVTGGSLPRGLVIDAETGAVSGSPVELGEAHFTITVIDANGFTASRNYTLNVTAPVLVITGTITSATVGKPFSAATAASGGTAPYIFSVDAPLPAGLTLNTNNGTLSGTPTLAGQYNFGIIAVDASGFSGRLAVALDIDVQPVVVLPSTLAVPRQDRAYAQAVTATGGTAPYTYDISSGSLPTGITLNTSTGRLSGTPTGSGLYTFEIRATDATNLVGMRNYTLEVQAAALLVVEATLDPVTAGVSYSDAISVSGGMDPYRFTIISGSLPSGIALDPVTGALRGTTLVPGSYNAILDITDTDGDTTTAGVSLQVVAPTILVSATSADANFGDALTGQVVATGGTAPYSFTITAGALPGGASLDPVTGALSGTATEAGVFHAVVTATDGNRFTETVSLDVAVAAPALNQSGLPSQFMLGQTVSESMVVTGGRAPYRFAVAGNLPAGLTLDPATGDFTGTPTMVGIRTFTITTTDDDGFSTSSSYSVEVATNVGNANLPGALPAAVAGESYAGAASATGGSAPLTYAVTGGTLPSGLTLDPSTGRIDGTTLQAGSFVVEVTVTGADRRINTATYALVVAAPMIAVDVQPLGAVAGIAYSEILDVSGGTAPYAYVIKSGTLPAGLTLNSGGLVAGTPSTAGAFSIVVTVTDRNGFASDLSFALTVSAPTIALTGSLSSGRIGLPYSDAMTIAGGTAPYHFEVTGGALPAGVTLDSDAGTLSGAPTTAGTFTFTISATDANGFTGAGRYDLVVATDLGNATLPISLASPTIGEAYSFSLDATGGVAPYSYNISAGSLPPGLSLDVGGTLLGTPTTPGTFSFEIGVVDAIGLVNHQTYAVSIAAPVITVNVVPPPAEVGTPYSVAVTAAGGTAPYSYAMDDAPPGMQIDPDTGMIDGTPTTAGMHYFTLLVTDARGFHAAQRFSMVVAAAPIVLDLPANLPNGVENASYGASLLPPNAVGAVTYSLTGGTQLPPGLSLNASGMISGMPTLPGPFSFSVHAADADGNSGNASYAVTIAAAPQTAAEATSTFLTASASSVSVGEAVIWSVAVTTSGGTADGGSVTLVDQSSGDVVAFGALASDGTASFSLAFETAANRTLIAQYGGTARFTATNSTGIAIAVTPASTTLVLSGGPGSITAGTSLSVVATTTRNAPATGTAGPGEIRFSVDDVDQFIQPANSGAASAVLMLLPGQHRISAAYVPTGSNDIGSDDDLVVTVTSPTTTTLAGPSGNIPQGESQTYNATVLPAELGVAPTGTVTFSDNGQLLATVPLVNGTADYISASPAIGLHAISAAFSGDTVYGASTSQSLSATVVAALDPQVSSATTLVASNKTPQIGETLVLTATVVGDGGILPTGSVTFVNTTSGITLGTAPLDGAGMATLALVLTDSSSTTIAALYSGDVRLLVSSDSLLVSAVVADTAIALAVDQARVLPGTTALLTAQVQRQIGGAANAGTVAFLADGTAFAHVATNGLAAITATTSPVWSSTVFTAEFIPGPSSHDGPAASIGVTVHPIKATPVVAVTGGVARDGSASGTVTVTAPTGVAATPTGDVQLSSSGAADQSLTLVNGVAAFAFPVGTFINTGVTFSADYLRDAQFISATGTTSVEPQGTMPTQTLIRLSTSQVALSQPVSATIEVTASSLVDGGLVEVFNDGGLMATVPVTNGTIVVALSDLELGSNEVTAHYLGSASFAPSQSNVAAVMVVDEPTAALSLTLSADADALFSVGQSIAVTALISSVGGPVSGIVLDSNIMLLCPLADLAAGATMSCTGTLVATAADLALGRVTIEARASAARVSAVSAELVLESVAGTVADTFSVMTENFVAARARMLGTAILLPNIHARLKSGTRAGTIQANHDNTSQTLAFTTSLNELRNWAAAEAANGLALGLLDEPLPLNVWIDAQYGVHAAADDPQRWGSIGTVAVGADYLITDDFMAGLMLQGDWATETSNDGTVEGSGFLIGPYVSIAFGEHLSLDATALYGKSTNSATATLFGETFSGDFDTTRLFVKGALAGYFEVDQFTLRPDATFVLTSESTGSYSVINDNGDAVSVTGADHLQYRLTVGGSGEYAIALDNGDTLTPMAGFDLGVTGTLDLVQDTTSAFVGRLTIGFDYETDGGLQLGLQLNTELDNSGFSSSNVSASLTSRF